MSLLLFASQHAGDLGSPYHHMQILQFALTIQHSDNFASTYHWECPRDTCELIGRQRGMLVYRAVHLVDSGGRSCYIESKFSWCRKGE